MQLSAGEFVWLELAVRLEKGPHVSDERFAMCGDPVQIGRG